MLPNICLNMEESINDKNHCNNTKEEIKTEDNHDNTSDFIKSEIVIVDNLEINGTHGL